jgi:hypothetical protein
MYGMDKKKKKRGGMSKGGNLRQPMMYGKMPRQRKGHGGEMYKHGGEVMKGSQPMYSEDMPKAKAN